MKRQIYEILKEVSDVKDRKVKVEILRKNNSPTLAAVLQGIFHPHIHFAFDKKTFPEYKVDDAPAGMGYTSLDVEFRRLYLFVNGSKKVDPNLTLERKSQLLVQILESLEGNEANVMKCMILKTSPYPGITYKLVQEAFPGLLPDDNTKEN